MPTSKKPTKSGTTQIPKKAEQVWRREHGSKKSAKDDCGAPIVKAAYGTTAPVGWTIDHGRPVSKGGTNAARNLKPMQTENNRAKSNKAQGKWTCAKPSGRKPR